MVKLDKMTGKTVWTEQGSERSGRLLVGDRRGRRRRADLPDLHRRRRRRRPRLGRQADVPLPERRERHRQHRHADLLRQQGVLHLRLRHRRRAARSHRAERRGQGEGDLLHAEHEEPSRRRGAGRRLSLRLQRHDPDLPGVRDRQADVARPQRRQGLAHLRRRQPLHPGREQRRRSRRGDPDRLQGEGALRDCRQGAPELGAPGDQRRPSLRAQPGHA